MRAGSGRWGGLGGPSSHTVGSRRCSSMPAARSCERIAHTVREQGHIGNQGASAGRAAHVDARAQTLGKTICVCNAQRLSLEGWGKRDA